MVRFFFFFAMSRQRYVGLGSVAKIHARPSKVWKMYFSDFKHGAFKLGIYCMSNFERTLIGALGSIRFHLHVSLHQDPILFKLLWLYMFWARWILFTNSVEYGESFSQPEFNIGSGQCDFTLSTMPYVPSFYLTPLRSRVPKDPSSPILYSSSAVLFRFFAFPDSGPGYTPKGPRSIYDTPAGSSSIGFLLWLILNWR